MKVLQVLDQAFRTTVEEQDDPILWLTQSMRGAGADLEVLLSGHGVYYAVQTKRQPTLELANWRQQQPADVTQDVGRLTEQGVPVYAVYEDLEERGLADLPVNASVTVIKQAELVGLYDRADQVWNW